MVAIQQENEQLTLSAAAAATRELRASGLLDSQTKLQPGQVETDYWSFTLRLLTEAGKPVFFMKIPKTSRPERRIQEALSDGSARHEARLEFQSLVEIKEFADANRLRALAPVLLLEEYGALITEFV